MNFGVKRFDVRDGCFKQSDAILESAESSVAVGTKKGADFSGIVAMVNSQVNGTAIAFAAGRLVADGTETVLGGEHGVVFVDSDSMPPYGAATVQLFFREFLFEQFFHVWKWLKSWNKATGLVMISWMLFARVKMYVHSSIPKLLSAVAAWFKFPSSGSKADSTTEAIEFWSICMRAIFNTGFTLPFEAVRAGWMCVKIGSGFDFLTSSAKFIVGVYRWEFIANLLPMASEFTRHGVLSTESALNGSFA